MTNFVVLLVFLFCSSLLMSHQVMSVLCPVSFALNENITTDYFTYPLDVFDRENSKNVSADKFMRCTLIDDHSKGYTAHGRTNHSCNKQQFCPITNENVVELSLLSDDVLSKPKHNVSICHLHQTLKQGTSEQVNMIAFGGSVTLGYFAGGCKHNVNECFEYLSECHQCSWMAYLGSWFKNHFTTAKVAWHNLALRGHGAAQYEALAITELKKHNITTLTSNDIVFFDFSVNDNACAHDCSHEIESGLESLVRHLYNYARDTANERKVPVSFPTIVLLESEPDLKRSELKKINVTAPYYKSYKRISELYHIPIWSYRDVVMSNYSLVHQASYSKTLKYFDIAGNHPGWAHHLFQADLYAAKLLSVFRGCDEWSNLHKADDIAAALAHQNNAIIQLIESPVSVQYNHTKPCNETAVRVLDLSYQNIVTNKTLVGAWRSYPEGAWQVREDVLGRGGFIRELNYSGFTALRGQAEQQHDREVQPHLNMNTTLTNTTTTTESKIVFTVAGITKQQVLKQKLTINLDIKYLRSYRNAGVVFIRYCGAEVSLSGVNYRRMKTAHHLDALWANYKEYRYSLPVMFSVPLSFDHCWFGKPVAGYAHTEVTFEVIYKVIDTGKLRSPSLVAARDKQKFKFVSIGACIV